MTSTSAEALLTSFSTDDKIGQILCTAVGHHAAGHVNAADDQHEMLVDLRRIGDQVTRFKLGGVCYFPGRPDGNLPEDVAAVTSALQAASPDVRLLISTDQEGGRVARLRRGFTLFGSAMALAATGDLDAVRMAARVSATELRAVGINHVFAPVADVNSNPLNPVIGTRSFGGDPAQVSLFLTAALQGYREGGVASTVKHFPGHGDTAADSHLGLPVVHRSRESWRIWDQPSFTAAISAGVDSVMAGHLVLGWADQLPATYSHRVLTGLLRDELGFSGLVVSDALEMEGAVLGRDRDQLVVEALLAGVDQLLMPCNIAGSVAALQQAIDDGRLSMQRLDEACLRVLTLKESLGLLGPSDDAARMAVTEVGQELPRAVELSRRAVTVLGSFSPLPLSARVLLVGDQPTVVDLQGFLVDRGCTVTQIGADRWSDPGLIAQANNDDAVLVVCNDAWKNPASNPPVVDLLRDLPGAILVAVGTPYDAALAPDRTVLLTYGMNGTQAAGLALALTDAERIPSGRLPVDICAQPGEGDQPGLVLFARDRTTG